MAFHLLIFAVACVYASVGHGGASGYLAVLSLFAYQPSEMASSALQLNLLVAGLSFLAYWRAGYFDWKLFWPFALASIPAAWVGGLWRIPPTTYSWLLAGALLFAAYRLADFAGLSSTEEKPQTPPLGIALPAGAGIGLLSGLIGVGGGIFLSPLILLLRWADAKRAAAVSAAFIWVNSAAALYGHMQSKGVGLSGQRSWILAAFLGGLLGSYVGSRHFNSLILRRLLAGVLLVAVLKLTKI